jgi:hypothetical protein
VGAFKRRRWDSKTKKETELSIMGIKFQIPAFTLSFRMLTVGFASEDVSTLLHQTFGISAETGTKLKSL